MARFPGNWGGIDWSHAAFDPQERHLHRQCQRDRLAADDDQAKPTAAMTCAMAISGSGTRITHMPCQVAALGQSLRHRCQYRRRSSGTSVLGVTDGPGKPQHRAAQCGRADRHRRRADLHRRARTTSGCAPLTSRPARRLWTFRLPASLYGTPLTYQGKSGKQYVAAVTTGGFWGEPADADDVTAFALP